MSTERPSHEEPGEVLGNPLGLRKKASFFRKLRKLG